MSDIVLHHLPGLLAIIATTVVIGLPILFVWGAVRSHRALKALRARARARGYEAESASRYTGRDGPIVWTGQTLHHDPLGSVSSEANNDHLPSGWHFAARWLPVDRLLEDAARALTTARAGGTAVPEAGVVRLRRREPGPDGDGPWQRLSGNAAGWWRREGPERLTQEQLSPVVDWMREQGVDEVTVRWTASTLEFWGFRAPDQADEAQFARFIELARALVRPLVAER